MAATNREIDIQLPHSVIFVTSRNTPPFTLRSSWKRFEANMWSGGISSLFIGGDEKRTFFHFCCPSADFRATLEWLDVRISSS